MNPGQGLPAHPRRPGSAPRARRWPTGRRARPPRPRPARPARPRAPCPSTTARARPPPPQSTAARGVTTGLQGTSVSINLVAPASKQKPLHAARRCTAARAAHTRHCRHTPAQALASAERSTPRVGMPRPRLRHWRVIPRSGLAGLGFGAAAPCIGRRRATPAAARPRSARAAPQTRPGRCAARAAPPRTRGPPAARRRRRAPGAAPPPARGGRGQGWGAARPARGEAASQGTGRSAATCALWLGLGQVRRARAGTSAWPGGEPPAM